MEHPVFPHVSIDVLVDVGPIVEAFAEEHGLEYKSYSPWELVSRHFAFVRGDE